MLIPVEIKLSELHILSHYLAANVKVSHCPILQDKHLSFGNQSQHVFQKSMHEEICNALFIFSYSGWDAIRQVCFTGPISPLTSQRSSHFLFISGLFPCCQLQWHFLSYKYVYMLGFKELKILYLSSFSFSTLSSLGHIPERHTAI